MKMAASKQSEDLTRERARASFSLKELTYLLDGGEDKWKRRKELEEMFYNDQEMQDDIPVDYMSHSELYENSLKKSLNIFYKAINLSDPREILTVADAIMHESSPMTVHFVMFIPALMGLATEDQQGKWLGPALEMKIIGSYAQTELGHGTFLRGLETTATYDPSSEEFILNTPTLSSLKWWPGSLGKTANHAIVLAQLYTKGECYGLHPFMVQIRSMENHQSLPGVTVGEIGPKMGLKASDNGFLKLDNLRIPRENMLMKNAQVTKDGTYIKPKSNKLNYGTMVFVRVLITDMVSFNVARACTIAVRYSAVRRQSEMIPGEPEVQILDYQAQQYKLLPLVALSQAFKATFSTIMDTYKVAYQDMEKGHLTLLPELHALSSGLKAFSTDVGSQAIEMCRMACGGHGFLLISGLPRLYATTVAACTYEGENTVLYLQTARYLIKVVNRQQQLHQSSQMHYLLNKPKSFHRLESGPLNFKNLDQVLELYKAVGSRLVHRAAERVQMLTSGGKIPEIANNLSQVDLIACSKANIRYIIGKKYSDWVTKNEMSPELRTVLTHLCHLWLLHHICENPGEYYEVGLKPEELNAIRDHLLELLELIRPEAVTLVDAFDFHDMVLNSALGCYDGKVYERLFELAQKSPLNRTDVHESYYKYLQPIIKSKL